MKNYFSSKTLIALAVAIAAAAAYETQANEQPIPPPASSGALPDSIAPGTPAAEVVKLAQAGVDAGVIQNYINNCPGAFNLSADTIIALTDAGVSSDMVNAMIAHDKNISASAPTAANPAPAATDNVSTAPPATEVTTDYLNDTLTPYGQWVEVDGYGRCWRPTTVVYDSTWQPYCDRGHWVYTDCGWYWDSDYSWGITFHYGRWFHHDRYGWCWWPDTVWAPSWVTWRSSGDYCGWAPLPPFTVYEPGFGFYYRGVGVAVGYDFGLATSCFTFVAANHFCEPQPRYYCVPPVQVTAIFNRTTVINNFTLNNHILMNNGVSVTVIGAATRHPIQPVHVGSMLNAGRQGWRGEGWNNHPSSPGGNRHFGASPTAAPTASSPGIGETHHQPVWNNGNNNNGESHNPFPTSGNSGNSGNAGGHRPPFTLPTVPAHSGDTHSGEINLPGHSQPNQNQNQSPGFPTPGKHLDQHQSGFNGHLFDNNQAFSRPSPASHSDSDWTSHQPTRTVSAAPVIASERPQYFDTHQNYQPATPHIAAPAPALPAAASVQAALGNAKLKNWLSQAH